jgi:hypothetical protein
MPTSVIDRRHQQLRRLYEAAERDRNPRRFFEDLRIGFETKEIKPHEFRLRPLFEQFVENGRELVDSWNPQHGGGVNLLEAGSAVDTSAFSNITGQIVYSEILAKMEMEDMVFSKLIPTVPTQFNGEKIAGIGRMGDEAEIIGEGQIYPTVGVNEDWIETPATTKRGLIVPVTKEAIFFDRTGVLLDRCREVGEWLTVNKEKRAIDCFIDENSTAHRYKWKGVAYATYQATSPWDNVTASNALVDWTDIDNAEQTLNNIIDPHTGEPVVIGATDLVVTKQLEATAFRIINATEIEVTTPGYATSGNPTGTLVANPYRGRYTLRTSRLLAARLATDTHWFLGNIAKQCRYMENWPITVVQAPNNSEAEFQQDVVQRFKASERGAYVTVEPRVTTQCTVA